MSKPTRTPTPSHAFSLRLMLHLHPRNGIAWDCGAYCSFEFRHAAIEVGQCAIVGVLHVERRVLAVDEIQEIRLVRLIRSRSRLQCRLGLWSQRIPIDFD